MTAQTATLTDFLLARIAEDEAAARLASSTIGDGCWWAADRGVRVPRATVAETVVPQHIARHDPARVLAECEASRRIVELHRDGGESQGYLPGGYGDMDHACTTCGSFGEYGEPWPCPTLRALALPYADHPDFQEAWRV